MSEKLIQGLAAALLEQRLIQASIVCRLQLVKVLCIGRLCGLNLLQDMAKLSLRIFLHDCPGKDGPLVGTQVMPIPPSTAHILIKIGAWVNVSIVGIKAV